MRAVTRQLAEGGKTHRPSIGSDSRAVHTGAADHRNSPLAVGACAQHTEGVVANQGVRGPSLFFELRRDAPIIERHVGAGHAEDARPGHLAVVVDSNSTLDRFDGTAQRLHWAVAAEAKVIAAPPAERSKHAPPHIDQGHVDFRGSTVDRQDRAIRKHP